MTQSLQVSIYQTEGGSTITVERPMVLPDLWDEMEVQEAPTTKPEKRTRRKWKLFSRRKNNKNKSKAATVGSDDEDSSQGASTRNDDAQSDSSSSSRLTIVVPSMPQQQLMTKREFSV